MATTTSRPSHAPNVVLIVGTDPIIPRIHSRVRLLPESKTPTQPDTSRNRPAGAPLRPPVIDGIEELDFLESGMPSSRLGCPLSLKTPNMGNTG